MEKRYNHTVNGQGVYEADLNAMGEAGALADDRILAELIKLGHGATCIIPTGHYVDGTYGMGLCPGCVVHPAEGGIKISPFRALIGPTADYLVNPYEHWRGVRSRVYPGYLTKGLNPNSSGAVRWDLVYAKLMPDQPSATESRKVKSPSDGSISTQTISPYLTTTVSIAAVTGTGSDLPSLPTPSAGEYLIPLAYVRVPAGFNNSTVLDPEDIWDVAPTMEIDASTGAVALKPATCQFTPAGGVNKIGNQTYSAVDGSRPTVYMPPSMSGGTSRLIAIDLASAVVSHANGDVIDESLEWRDRLFKWSVFAHATADTPAFPWEAPISVSEDKIVPSAINGATGSTAAQGLGQSLFTDASPNRVVLHLNNTKLSALGAGNEITLYVSGTGTDEKLRIGITGTPAVKLFIWLDATGKFTNR